MVCGCAAVGKTDTQAQSFASIGLGILAVGHFFSEGTAKWHHLYACLLPCESHDERRWHWN
eukprot:1333253-Amphidinium_carterae.1